MHAHLHDGDSHLEVGRLPRILVLLILAAVAVVTVFGVVTLWPNSNAVHKVTASSSYAAPGVTFPEAVVTGLSAPCPVVPDSPSEQPPKTSQPTGCGVLTVKLKSNSETVHVSVPPEVSKSGLRAGDQVQLMRAPGQGGQPAQYAYWTTNRSHALLWAGLIFALLVVVVGRLRGLMALVGAGVGAVILARFVLPALLTGENGLWVALAAAGAIMYVVLYATHGLSLRTSVALLGTLTGIVLTAIAGHWIVGSSRLTGVTDESGGILAGMTGGINFQSLLLCSVVIAGLGVLNDVTITQTSAVWELRGAGPHQSRMQIFRSAMRIGRDHIASTIYTIIFAYAGSALVLLLVIAVYDQPLLSLLSAEDIAEEVARTLASGIGLVLAMPVTTALAALIAGPTHGRRPATVEAPREAFEEFWARR